MPAFRPAVSRPNRAIPRKLAGFEPRIKFHRTCERLIKSIEPGPVKEELYKTVIQELIGLLSAAGRASVPSEPIFLLRMKSFSVTPRNG
jgi:hypothetical protein